MGAADLGSMGMLSALPWAVKFQSRLPFIPPLDQPLAGLAVLQQCSVSNNQDLVPIWFLEAKEIYRSLKSVEIDALSLRAGIGVWRIGSRVVG